MDSWELHVNLKNMEHQTEKFVFISRLIHLYASITAEGEYRDDANFLKCKQDLLDCELMKQKDLHEFREWVEGITPDETDGTRVRAVFDSYASSYRTAN